MNILITGGLGLIGHNVAQRLIIAGHSVTIVDNKTNYGIIPQEEIDYLLTERLCKVNNAKIYYEDIADQVAMEKVFKHNNFDVVMHLASFPRQKVVNANPSLGARTMVEGLLILLELSIKHKVQKFMYTSSSMVYGDFNHCILEDEPCNPIGQYGIMKYMGEKLVEDYHRKYGINYTIIRPSAVYGPLDVEDRVISKFILTAMRNGTLKVKGEKEMLDFTYVDDAAAGIVAATLSPTANNKTYNITKGASKTLLEAAHLAVKIVGKGSISIEPKDNDFPSRASLNINRAKQDFGYDPKVDVEEGFVQYYNWLQSSTYWQTKLNQAE